MYIYIYILTYTCMCIYIYIYDIMWARQVSDEGQGTIAAGAQHDREYNKYNKHTHILYYNILYYTIHYYNAII